VEHGGIGLFHNGQSCGSHLPLQSNSNLMLECLKNIFSLGNGTGVWPSCAIIVQLMLMIEVGMDGINSVCQVRPLIGQFWKW
jgi:hypothetical protein